MKIGLELISPVHIGSGVQYQGNAEYIYFADEKVLALVEESKVLDIIGIENIHIWVSYIENREGSFLDYLRQRQPSLKPEDIAKRLITLKGGQTPYFTNTLREQIHGGFSKPYIPGSSIKGAIRTAIFANTLKNSYKDKELSKQKVGKFDHYKNKFIINDKPLQKEVFGQNPNSDWLRMLQVGDCYFPTQTHATFAETLNERGEQQYEIKSEVRQLIEYIPAEVTAEFPLTIPQKQFDQITKALPNLFPPPASQLNYNWLCQTIHKHTLRLLDNEIYFFEDAALPSEAEGLLDFLSDLKRAALAFSDNQCLLRLGFGTGYRNMTGDWVQDLVTDDDLFDDIATSVRRTSRYNGMPLPKSRKIMFDGVMPGFVKLTFTN